MKSTPKRIIIFFMHCFLLPVFFLPGICIAENGVKDDEILASEDLFEGFVYFADKHKTALKSVNFRLPSTLDSNKLGQEIIRMLIQGPSQSFLEPTWPKDVKLNSLFIADDGKAYVDLNLEKAMLENMDTQSELLAIYSMVNSLTLNIPKINEVKILINGNDAFTLAGHIDLEYFYKTNMLIVK
jgi:hypothetical protein